MPIDTWAAIAVFNMQWPYIDNITALLVAQQFEKVNSAFAFGTFKPDKKIVANRGAVTVFTIMPRPCGIIYAVKPFEWKDEFAAVNVAGEQAGKAAFAKWKGLDKDRWHSI